VLPACRLNPFLLDIAREETGLILPAHFIRVSILVLLDFAPEAAAQYWNT
jgi:hypothetical protein